MSFLTIRDRVTWPSYCRNLKPELRVGPRKTVREIELKNLAIADLHRDRGSGSCAVICYKLDAEQKAKLVIFFGLGP